MLRSLSLLVVAALVGGCLGGSNPPIAPQSGSDEPEIHGPAAVSDTQGGIEGVVIDSSLLPLPGVSIHLREGSGDAAPLLNTTTGLDGSFTFDLVVPGTYRVTATQPGFGNVTQVAVVIAGEVARVRLLLSELPTDEPYVTLFIQNGLISCAGAIVIVSFVCLPTQTEPVFGPYNIALFFDIPKGHQTVVSETDWADKSQHMRNWFFHDETRDTNFEGDWMGDAIGTPVLRKEFFPDVVPGSFAPAQTEHLPFPSSDQNFTFLSATYYDGSYQKDINGTASPACELNPIIGYCSGVGVALGYRFTEYVTVFVNQKPDALPAYSAVPDQ